MQKRDFTNAVFDIAGESFWGFQAAMISSATVLVMILRQFGAGRPMIASITSIETCATLFPQVLGLYVFRSRRRLKQQIVGYHYVVMIPLIFAISWLLHESPHLAPSVVRTSILVCWGFFMCSIGVVIAVWLDWIAALFDVRIRGTVMGLAFCGAFVLGAAGGLLSGWIISHGHTANVYSSIYLLAGAIATGAMTLFWFIDDSAAPSVEKPLPTAAVILASFRSSLADHNFRAFLTGRILATSGFCILPLVADYFSTTAGGALRPGTLVSCGAAIAAGTALSNLGLGRLGDKLGHRLGLLIGASSQIVALLVLLTLPGISGCLIVYFAAGICAGSAFLSHYNMVFETCPHDNRTAHITVANLVIGVFTAFTPLAAGFAASLWGIRTVFEASLVLSVIALAWFAMRVREPRDTAFSPETAT